MSTSQKPERKPKRAPAAASSTQDQPQAPLPAPAPAGPDPSAAATDDERPPVKAKPVAPREKGVGAPCPRCKSVNTRVRDTKGPGRYPAFMRERVRYHGCADCGASWRTDA
jgi:hypothetical protein